MRAQMRGGPALFRAPPSRSARG